MTDQHTPARTGLTAERLDEITARANAEHLTPGPWTLDRESCDCSDGYCSHGAYVTGVVTPVPTEIAADRCKRTGEQPRDYDFHRSEIGDFTDADWELMAHAREDVPALLAEIRRLHEPTELSRHLEDGSTHTVQALTDAGESCVQQQCTAAREEARLRQEQYTLRAEVEGVLDEVGHMADDERLTADVAGELRRLLRAALGLDRQLT